MKTKNLKLEVLKSFIRKEVKSLVKENDEDYDNFQTMIKDGEVWLAYYEPSSSKEYTDGENWYNIRGVMLRNPDEYDDDTEGYTPFGDE